MVASIKSSVGWKVGQWHSCSCSRGRPPAPTTAVGTGAGRCAGSCGARHPYGNAVPKCGFHVAVSEADLMRKSHADTSTCMCSEMT